MGFENMLEIGDKIEITVERDYAETITCFSLVQDLTSTDKIIVTLPMLEGRLILLNPKDIISVMFFRDKGCFSFKAQVLERFRIKNAAFISLKQVSSVKKIQRRYFYRLKITLPVEFQLVQDNQVPTATITPFKGYTTDISGGGMRLVTDEELNKNMIIKCSIQLEEAENISLMGKVVRKREAQDSPLKYEVGICFHKTTENTRNTLIKFIFQKQRKLIERGLM